MREFCFHCEQIAEEDKEITADMSEYVKNKEFHDMMGVFNEFSIMNPKLVEATFQTYVPPNDELAKAKAICVRYAQNFDKKNPVNLMMHGTYGTGKSHLAASIAKLLMKNLHSCLFVSMPKLLSMFRESYSKTSDFSELKLMKLLYGVECLIIDDLGAEKGSDWATEKLFEIVDSRAGKHTIYTTNFQPKELAQVIGGRNFSRIMENTTRLEMVGNDYRLRNFN